VDWEIDGILEWKKREMDGMLVSKEVIGGIKG
jgi:hypothetical protein